MTILQRMRLHNELPLMHPACMLILMLLSVSCVSQTANVPTSKQIVPTEEKIQEQEEITQTSDMACAYFYFLWGKTAENNQRFEEALEAYEKALLCDENGDYVKKKLAFLLIKMDRKEQAANFLEQIVSDNPEDTESLVLLAKVYSSLDRDEDAVAIYRELLEIKEDHDTLLMLGTLYARNKEYDKARKILNRLIRLEGDSYMAHYYLARLYREMQYFDKASASYEKALQLNWFERLAYEVVEFYEDRKEYQKAIKLYNRIIEEDESPEMAKTRLVNLYLRMEENDKALELLRELRTMLPESHSVDITISRILLEQEKYDEAIMILEDVLKTNPELTVVRYLLAMSYYRNNDIDNAELQLKQIPRESNLHEDSIFLQVKILSERDRQDRAITLLRDQVEDPAARKPSFYILLASLYRENDNPKEGRKVYGQALRLYPEDVDLIYNYGIFLEKVGDHEEAMSRMQEVIKLDPDNGAALNYVGYTWADSGRNLAKALKYITKAVEFMPDDGYVRDSLGWVYFKMGNISRAITELERAAEMVEDDPVIREHLGDAYLEGKQLDKALAAYESSYELYEDEEKKNRVAEKINSIKSRGAR